MKKKVYFLFALPLFACAIIGCKNRSDSILSDKPNIIFIFSDDLSYRDLSCYGQENYSTPNLDNLALNGLMFSQAYSGASECAPSRGSLMTGMHMGHCRIRANRSARGQDHLMDEDITVAEVLKESGYVNGFIGKWGIGLPGTEGTPEKQGFDYSFGYYDQLRAHSFFPDFLLENGDTLVLAGNHGFNMDRVYRYGRLKADEPSEDYNRYDKKGILLPDGVADPEKAIYSEILFQDAALDFIRENRDTSFFLYYATQLPHGPTITPDISQFLDRDWPLKNKEWAAMVTHMDRGVGKMVSLLEDEGIINNTVIFFAGDNGYSQWGYFGRPRFDDDPVFHNRGPWPKGKFTSTHEGGMRVPFFVYWKGRVSPGSSDHVCALFDFLSTAADIAGTEPPQTDGISLLPLISGNEKKQRGHEYLYWENGTHTPHARSLRYGKWWAFSPHPDQATELYDLDSDIQCKNNLADENPEVLAKVMAIFDLAHEDSKWYRNPGEDDKKWNEKIKAAEREGSLQNPTRANTTFSNISNK